VTLSKKIEDGPSKSAAMGVLSERPDRDLVAHLEAICRNGAESSSAVDRYDPDFPRKLSKATNSDAAEELLADWLNHRFATLQRTQNELRVGWETGRAARAGS
jgi:hypothetical protein